MGGRRWTEEEEIYLVHHLTRHSTSEMASVLNRSFLSVSKRVELLSASSARWRALKQHPKPPFRTPPQEAKGARTWQPYTADEDAFIVQMFGVMKVEALARQVGRTYPAVRMRYFYLKRDPKRFARLQSRKLPDDTKGRG